MRRFLVQGELPGPAPPGMGVHACVCVCSWAPAGVLFKGHVFFGFCWLRWRTFQKADGHSSPPRSREVEPACLSSRPLTNPHYPQQLLQGTDIAFIREGPQDVSGHQQDEADRPGDHQGKSGIGVGAPAASRALWSFPRPYLPVSPSWALLPGSLSHPIQLELSTQLVLIKLN